MTEHFEGLSKNVSGAVDAARRGDWGTAHRLVDKTDCEGCVIEFCLELLADGMRQTKVVRGARTILRDRYGYWLDVEATGDKVAAKRGTVRGGYGHAGSV